MISVYYIAMDLGTNITSRILERIITKFFGNKLLKFYKYFCKKIKKIIYLPIKRKRGISNEKNG